MHRMPFSMTRVIVMLLAGIFALTLFVNDLRVATAQDLDTVATSVPDLIKCEEAGVLVVQTPEGDFDEDGLTNAQEQAGYDVQGDDSETLIKIFPDPCDSDSDGDGLSDRDELAGNGPSGVLTTEIREGIDEWKTDPTKPDHDGDGVSDGDEFEQYTISLNHGVGAKKLTVISNPTKKDTDGDGLDDSTERAGWSITVNGEERRIKSSPQHVDTDKDGLTDEEEFNGVSSPWGSVKTDPTSTDTDADGIPDKTESKEGSVRLDPTSRDTDGDGLEDKTELDSEWCDATRADTDGDGRADGLSVDLDCGIYDQDKDGLPDFIEKELGLDPENVDTDADGLSDREEISGSTHPKVADTDGDGTLDQQDGDPNLRPGTLPLPNSQSATSPASQIVLSLSSEIDRLEGELQTKDALIDGYQERLRNPIPNGSVSSRDTDGLDIKTESSNLISFVLIVVVAGIALVAGAAFGYVIRKQSPATGHVLQRQAMENLRTDPDLRRQLANEIRQEPAFVGQVRQEITGQLNQERGTSLNAIQSDLINRLNSTRTELRGAVAATNRGIPEAMLQEAESLILPASDNNKWAENLAVASSLIRNVARYYLGHNPAN